MNQHIKMPAVLPRVQYTANGVDVNFEFSFPIFASDDITIQFDGTVQVSGYVINGAGDTNGGSVTFDVAPSSGIIVTIERNIPYERLTDFLESGDFSADALNTELDYLMASVQQLHRDHDRMLRYENTEGEAVTSMPSVQNRANKVLGFDGDGNPTPVDYGLTQSPPNFVASGVNAVTRLSTDKMADVISVKDFGAVGDGINDDTIAIQSAINAHDCVYIPSGIYRVTNSINISSNKKIFGAGDSSVIRGDSNLFNILSIRGGYNIVSDLKIENGDTAIFFAGVDAPCVQNRFKNLIIQKPNNGIVLDGYDDTNKPCYWNIFQSCLILSPNDNGVILTKSSSGDTPHANIFDGCRVYSQGAVTSGHGIHVEHGSFYNRFINCEINVDGSAQSCMMIGANANETVIDNLYCESSNGVPNLVLKSGSQKTLIQNLLAMSDGTAILDESGGAYQSINAGNPVGNKFNRTQIDDLTAMLIRQDTVFIDKPSATQVALDTNISMHLVSAFNGEITIDLPLPNNYAGAIFTIKKIDQTGNAVVISEPNGLGIDRKAQIILGGPYDYVTILSNGAEWFVMSSNRMAGNTKYYDTNGILDIDMSVDTYLISSYGGAVTCRLPPANASEAIGRTITIKKTDNSSNQVLVSEQGGNGPDQYTQPLNAQYNAMTVTSNGGQWYIVSKF